MGPHYEAYVQGIVSGSKAAAGAGHVLTHSGHRQIVRVSHSPWQLPPLTFGLCSSLLIVDANPSYSRPDEFSQEGRAMSNAMLGVEMFVPRPSVPNGAGAFQSRTVPIV